MTIRLTLDDNLNIIDVFTIMDSHPYSICPEIIPNFKDLIGLTIGKDLERMLFKSRWCKRLYTFSGIIVSYSYYCISNYLLL